MGVPTQTQPRILPTAPQAWRRKFWTVWLTWSSKLWWIPQRERLLNANRNVFSVGLEAYVISVQLDTHYLLIKSVSIVAVAKAVTPSNLKSVMDVTYLKSSILWLAHASIPHALILTVKLATSTEFAKAASKDTPFTTKFVPNAPTVVPHAKKLQLNATEEPVTQVSSSTKIPKMTLTIPA